MLSTLFLLHTLLHQASSQVPSQCIRPEPLRQFLQCQEPPFELFATQIQCNADAECCNCTKITCDNCLEVACTNLQSCANSEIIINGINNGGAKVDCTGQRSCENVRMIGNQIFSVLCNRALSCDKSMFFLNDIGRFTCASNACQSSTFELNAVEAMNCQGSLACQGSTMKLIGSPSTGATLDCFGSRSCSLNRINAENLNLIACSGINACDRLTLEGKCLENGCALQCSGTDSCGNVTMKLNGIDSVNCNGLDACRFGTFNLECNAIGCALAFDGLAAGFQSAFEVKNSFGLTCRGQNACASSTFQLIDNKGGVLYCEGLSSCLGLTITGLTDLNEVICFGVSSCLRSTFAGTCDELGCPIECIGEQACQASNFIFNDVTDIICGTGETLACANSQFTVTPHDNAFRIESKGSIASQGTTFTIVIDNNNVNRIKSISCLEFESCRGATFIIDASLSSDVVILEEIKCIDGCVNTRFTLINAMIDEANVEVTGGDIIRDCRDTSNTVLDTSQCFVTMSV